MQKLKQYLLYFAVSVLLVFAVHNIWIDRHILSFLNVAPKWINEKNSPQTSKSFITDWEKPFCQPWSASDANNRSLQPFDLWHTHHPDWVVTSEEDDEFCVEPVGSRFDVTIRNMMLFYVNQFHSSCKIVYPRYHWGSGWPPDFWNCNLGLINGLHNRVPAIMTSWSTENKEIGIERTHPWNYAANKADHGKLNQTSLVCEAGDTTCYFLPYHGCGPHDDLKNDPSVQLLSEQPWAQEFFENSGLDQDVGWSAYLYMTRKQVWIRRAVFDYKKKFKQTNAIETGSDCTAIHVRRGDVILESRRYYPLAFYVDMIPDEKLTDPNHYIFLLTDDSSVIDEAHEFFPNLKWVYFDRPRHRGSQAKWEDHTPSKDPALEVIIILAASELVPDCSTIVHGPSGFSNFLYIHMERSKRHPNLARLDIRDHPSFDRFEKLPINETDAEVHKYLEEMRQQKTAAP